MVRMLSWPTHAQFRQTSGAPTHLLRVRLLMHLLKSKALLLLDDLLEVVDLILKTIYYRTKAQNFLSVPLSVPIISL